MSKSFSLLISSLFKSIDKEIKFLISGIGTVGHLCYAIATREEKEIIVKKKYKFDKNGFTDFMIVDINDKHYNLNNSLWYWKWNSIEDWHSIKELQTLHTVTYGLRIPVFGCFPNIVSSQNNKNTKIDDIIVKDISLEQDLSDGKYS